MARCGAPAKAHPKALRSPPRLHDAVAAYPAKGRLPFSLVRVLKPTDTLHQNSAVSITPHRGGRLRACPTAANLRQNEPCGGSHVVDAWNRRCDLADLGKSARSTCASVLIDAPLRLRKSAARGSRLELRFSKAKADQMFKIVWVLLSCVTTVVFLGKSSPVLGQTFSRSCGYCASCSSGTSTIQGTKNTWHTMTCENTCREPARIIVRIYDVTAREASAVVPPGSKHKFECLNDMSSATNRCSSIALLFAYCLSQR